MYVIMVFIGFLLVSLQNCCSLFEYRVEILPSAIKKKKIVGRYKRVKMHRNEPYFIINYLSLRSLLFCPLSHGGFIVDDRFSFQLCRNALTWAKTLAKDDKFMHQPDNPFGENLFSMWSSNRVTAKDAICNWYKEAKNYDYSKEPRVLKSGNLQCRRSRVRSLDITKIPDSYRCVCSVSAIVVDLEITRQICFCFQ